MEKKKIKRAVRYFLARILLRVAAVCGYFLPLFFTRRFCVFLCKILYRLSRYYRELAFNNLRIVFPEKGEKENKEILLNSLFFLGTNVADTFWFLAHTQKRKNLVNLRNIEILDRALNARCGVVGVTAHIGAFTIIGGVLTQYGYKVNYLLRNPRDEKMKGLLERGLRMQGVSPIFTKPGPSCVEKAIARLRNNEILIILIDQEAGNSGIWVRFFSRYTSAPAGPVIFSLRTHAPIVPMFMLKEGQKMSLSFYPEFKLIPKSNLEKTIFENTQDLISFLEKIIKEYPEQWSWIDRRWRITIDR
ncbi:MAG: hypothetical protein NC920_04535 [Candidatus Omnitrophica bacterium]|nr:hypothetical protein [Candidatus Omnitrophota bacterium]MCM8798940.1 hypothetical protein [Candidatus Omnitrophota bacterium]